MVKRLLVVLLLALASTTACEPPVPLPTLLVNTQADGLDAVPGDGVCEMTEGAGDCSLRAAVDEGNALGAAAISVPDGEYNGQGFEVTGNLSINDGAPVNARLLSQRITVRPGASLVADGLSSYAVPGVRFTVEGSFVGRHLSVVGLESSGQLVVAPNGVAVIENSLFVHVFGNTASVQNGGTVVLRHTALLAWSQVGVFTNALSNSSTAYVASTILQSCIGSDPVSVGYNSDIDGSCGLAAAGDQPGAPPAFTPLFAPGQPVTYDLASTSPLVDAIPVGTNGCGTDVLGDMSLVPRPVDGNGDGVVGCDIGARELPTSP